MLNPNFAMLAGTGLDDQDFLSALIADHVAQQSMGALQGLGGPRMVQPPVMEQLPAFRPRGMSFADVANALGIAMNSQQGNQARAGAQIGMQRLDRNQAMQMQNDQANVNVRNRNRQNQYAAEQSAANNEFNARVRGATVKAQLDQRAADQAANRLHRSQTAREANLSREKIASERVQSAGEVAKLNNATRMAIANAAQKNAKLRGYLTAISNASPELRPAYGAILRSEFPQFADITDAQFSAIKPSELMAGARAEETTQLLPGKIQKQQADIGKVNAETDKIRAVIAQMPEAMKQKWANMAGKNGGKALSVEKQIEVLDKRIKLLGQNKSMFDKMTPAYMEAMSALQNQRKALEKQLQSDVVPPAGVDMSGVLQGPIQGPPAPKGLPAPKPKKPTGPRTVNMGGKKVKITEVGK